MEPSSQLNSLHNQLPSSIYDFNTFRNNFLYLQMISWYHVIDYVFHYLSERRILGVAISRLCQLNLNYSSMA